MQRLEVSGVVRLIYRSLGVKGLINVYYYTNICTNKQCKININITQTCFVVNTPSSGSLQDVSANVMNY